MSFASSYFRAIRPFLIFALCSVAVLTFSRLSMALWQSDRIVDFSAFLSMMHGGLRIDLTSVSFLLLLPALFHGVLMMTPFRKHWLSVLKVWFLAAMSFLIFMELSTPAFINEYDLRPNRLFIEYLIYPKEVASMLLAGHLFEIIVVNIAMAIAVYFTWKLINKKLIRPEDNLKVSGLTALIATLTMVIVLFGFARGTVGHRPINPALVYFSTDPLVNALTLNSGYSVMFALNQLSDEKNASKMYGNLPQERVFELVRAESELGGEMLDPEIPTLNVKKAFHQGKPRNLVIVLEESVGAQFVSSLGGINLMPELDKIMESGWMLGQLYATGTRSVRGIEATITGFTPTPARAVVKLDKSQQGFFTIAEVLERHGYTTQFVYGGESHFDNMKSFFLGNGFNSIIDFDDIESPEYVAAWGASDEDLFNQADKELMKLHQGGKPYFSLIFSSSNHDPFDIPQGKVEPLEYTDEQREHYGARELSRHHAIQYADYALGKFIKKARTQPYWQDTVFLVVADHDARVYGDGLVPIKNFHIPGVILNSGMPQKRDERVASNIDMTPTLLSLIGIEDPTPTLGFDLTKQYGKERAIMQFANNFAYMKDQRVAILQPRKPIQYYTYDLETKKLTDAEADEAFGENALAHALFGSIAYAQGLYRLPKQESKN